MTASQKKLNTFLKGISCEVRGKKNISISGITHRSRDVRPGFLFVAIPGLKVDGKKFIPDALAAGACALLFEGEFFDKLRATQIRVPGGRLKGLASPPPRAKPTEPPPQRPLLRAGNDAVRTALAKLSAAFYDHPTKAFYLSGVTGTNGKTTFTYLMEWLWQGGADQITADRRSGVIGTINTRYGDKQIASSQTTPESRDLQELFYEMKRERVTRVVMEVSSHGIEMQRVRGCQFDSCVFTNLTQDHLDYHGSMEKYYRAKEKLFTDHLLESVKKNKRAIINADSAYGEKLIRALKRKNIPVWTFGSHKKCDLHNDGKIKMSIDGFVGTLSGLWGKHELQVPMTGKFNLSNVMAAVLTAYHSGMTPEEIVGALKNFSGVPGRLEKIDQHRVFVDYAHTPDALKNVLRTLKPLTKGKLITVFGCGGDRDKGKRPKMGFEAAKYSDICLVTSDNPRTESPAAIIDDILPGVKRGGAAPFKQGSGFIVEEDRKKAIEQALSLSQDGDVVLIAGKGHEDYQIIGNTKHHFSDQEVVREILG